MHPAGSQWISSRASILGIGAAVVLVLLIFAVGLGVATYSVRDVQERATLAAETTRLLKQVQAEADAAGVWPPSVEEAYVVTVPPQTSPRELHPDQVVLVQNRSGRPVDRNRLLFGGSDRPVRSHRKSGFTFGEVTGQSLSDLVGPSAGVGIAIALAGGDVLILQDETPLRDVRLFFDAESAALADRRTRLDTYSLRFQRRSATR